MNTGKIILRNLVHYRRMNLCVVAGAALATAILVGALGTGDSVEATLRSRLRQRRGRVEAVLAAGDRSVRGELAAGVARAASCRVAPVFTVGGAVKGYPVNAHGIDERFWLLGPSTDRPTVPGPDEAVINRRLADTLDVGVGETILLRVDRPSLLPRELSLTGVGRSTLGLRLSVKEIVGADRFGDFRLQKNPGAAHNVFVSRAWLAEELGLGDRANLLLAGAVSNDGQGPSVPELNAALQGVWTAGDAGLDFRALPDGAGTELTSDRIFIDPAIAQAALSVEADGRPIVSYLVNSIRGNGNTIPYSFASAPGADVLPLDPGPDEVLLNAWAADDLGVKPGDPVVLTYYVPGPLRRLVERTNQFDVAGVVPMTSPVADPGLVPELPGISDAETCADWDPGIPIDLDRIRPEDEAYWEAYRGTPKAFLATVTATNLWHNRYGTYTSIRFDSTNAPALVGRVMQHLDPAQLGLAFAAVGETALDAAGGSVDFGQLFLSLSVFILASALLLTGLLFVFNVQSRGSEIRTLLYVGWTRRRVQGLFLAEGALLATVGSVAGTGVGLLYHRGILAALDTVWEGAVASTQVVPAVQAPSVVAGWGLGLLVSLGVMAVALRRITAAGGAEAGGEGCPRGTRWRRCVIAGMAAAAAAGILVTADVGRGRHVAGLFFATGTLLLVACLAALSAALMPPPPAHRPASVQPLTRAGLMLRGCRLRRGRTMAAVTLLASGIFVVVAVSANRHATVVDPERRDAGTGGFAFFMKTAVPVVHDLATEQGRRDAGLSAEAASRIDVVPMRLLQGDDASCLNLGRVTRPRVLGVDPAQLGRRGAFAFANLPEGTDPGHPWRALNTPVDAHTIPAVADQTVITWSLGKGIGDTIPLRTVKGRPLHAKLIGGLRNSILQGYVLVSERLLLERVPGITGTRVFLVDAPAGGRAAVAQDLREAFRDHGVIVVPAARRLEQFSVVQNTYLGIFLILGGLGVILGTAGVGIVLLRNVLERRRELGILRAVGFTRRALFALVLGEHALILASGILCGVPPAVVAVLPSIATAGRSIPWFQLESIIGLVVVSALFWIAAATTLALRGHVLQALREE